jgi:hypothetical protein
VGERVKQGATRARDTALHGYEALQHGYEEAGRVLQDRPGQAIGIAFGLGLAAGVGMSLWLMADRRQEAESFDSVADRTRDAAERLGRQMLDALASVMPSRN